MIQRYLRLSLTGRCNLRCRYCMPNGYVPGSRSTQLTLEERVRACRLLVREFGITKIRLTGGEPLIYQPVVELTRRLAALPGLGDLAVTTNGIHLARLARPLREAGMRRVNLSMDSLDRECFRQLCQSDDLPAVLAGLDAALAEGLLPVKINAVIIRGVTDDMSELRRFLDLAWEKQVQIRFLELMPIGGVQYMGPDAYLPAPAIRALIETGFGPMRPQGRSDGGTSAEFEMEYRGRSVRLGFVTPVSEPFCVSCGRFRLTSEGRLITCLRSQRGTDLLTLIRRGDEEALTATIREHLDAPRHDDRFDGPRPMTAIGG